MSREYLILWAGRHQRRDWEELCADYRKRIQRTTPIRDHMVKVKGSSEDPGRVRAEGAALLAAVPDPSWTVVLDPRGKTQSSEAFAGELARLHDEWPHSVTFIIGSDAGLDPEVVKKARRRLSFGPMIFGHELARLVLYEQLYRALCIQRGIKYHRR